MMRQSLDRIVAGCLKRHGLTAEDLDDGRGFMKRQAVRWLAAEAGIPGWLLEANGRALICGLLEPHGLGCHDRVRSAREEERIAALQALFEGMAAGSPRPSRKLARAVISVGVELGGKLAFSVDAGTLLRIAEPDILLDIYFERPLSLGEEKARGYCLSRPARTLVEDLLFRIPGYCAEIAAAGLPLPDRFAAFYGLAVAGVLPLIPAFCRRAGLISADAAATGPADPASR